MATDGAALVFSVASVVEDVLQQHGNRSRDLDLDARRAEEAGTRFSLFFFPLSLWGFFFKQIKNKKISTSFNY